MKKILDWIKNLFGQNRINICLEKALNTAAPDGGSWQAGEEAFISSFNMNNDVDESLKAALTKSAPDGGSWQAGEAVFQQEWKATKQRKIVFFVVIAIVALIIVFGVTQVFASNTNNQQPAQTAVTVTNQTTYKMVYSDYSNNRWFADGIVEILNAKTPEESAKAAMAWLDRVKTDPILLTGASHYFLKEDIAPAEFIDNNGFATDKAIAKTSEIAMAIANAKSVTAAEAPADGYNSGVENGTVVQSSSSGISGDRTAIQVVLADGSTVWIMARCGNPVTTGSPGLPTGKTDNPPPVVVTPSTTPTPPDNSKDPADNVTPPQGVTQQPAANQTDGHQSSDQIKSGDTSSNVIDNPVNSNTTSGSVTSDTGSNVGVGGTNSTPDVVQDDVKDDTSTVYNDGGTNGNTQISDPG